MFFKIMAAHNCLAIRLDKIDVVRLDYQLDDTSPNMLSMYQADQDTPVRRNEANYGSASRIIQ